MLTFDGQPVEIWRDEQGTPHVQAGTLAGLCWGQGVAHATDRALQMLLMRIVCAGRISELLDSSDSALEADTFFRRVNFAGALAAEIEKLDDSTRAAMDSYCRGVNSVLERKRHVPWEFKLLRYRPEPWRIEHTLMIARLMGYVTLQQSQAEMERLLVELVQVGVDDDRLEELFPGLLAGLDRELLQQVVLGERVVPAGLWTQPGVVRMLASNNWVLAGSRTASGLPLLCNDPHLEGNRLPAVWCEIALHGPGQYAVGGSMPGGPGVVIGRTRHVAWGATYAFADAVDSWIERCRDGSYFRQPDQWLPFDVRREVILRKKKESVERFFYENPHGVLDGDPNLEGLYLATRWAAARSGAGTFRRLLAMWDVTSVEQAAECLGQIETTWNFVIADRQGNIGYQMSGLIPQRPAAWRGVVPLPGWQPENDWQGYVPWDQLPRQRNPEQGYCVTANHDLNGYGAVAPINLCMGAYRAERIGKLLEEKSACSVADMFAMHFDVVSTQAERFLAILRPLLPDTEQGALLRDWDCRYTLDSTGAFLFERFYRQLFRSVFGGGGLGDPAVQYLVRETGVLADFYVNFDRILLAEQSAWFGGRLRDDIYRQAAAEALTVQPQTWGDQQQYMLNHLLLGGKLPRWLGFDRGPVGALGGRATIHQGQVYRSGGRTTTFVPSYRFVTDLATDDLFRNLAGGPSDRRFSRWYCSGLADWLAGTYPVLEGLPTGRRSSFP